MIFEPYKLGTMELKNRLVLAPMSCNLSQDGYVTERMIAFFEERAKGGVGLITIGDGIVEYPLGNNTKESLAVDDNKYIPRLHKLVLAMKSHGAKTCLQLSHGGRRAGRVSKNGCLDITRGMIPVAPSSIPHPAVGHVVPKALSKERIDEIVTRFGEAAQRAVEAGFDAVGLHCAHMYLCGQFLSPWANQRTDEYGGNLEGRLRFVDQIIEEIQKKIGADYPLIIRMNGQEPDEGNSLIETQEIARHWESMGVAAIHVSVGFGVPLKKTGFLSTITPMRASDGCLVHLAENIKKVISIPVIAVNKIGDVGLAERILEEGKADLIAMGRSLVADPYLPLKAMEGRAKEIVPCIFCCQGCFQNVLELDEAVACTVNPRAGRENDFPMIAALEKKKVLVVGGGPGGLMAALMLAQRGHAVYLYEKDSSLGGRLNSASLPPGKGDIGRLKDYLVGRIKERPDIIICHEEVTPETIDKLKPEALVIAAGGKPVVPLIPGIDSGAVVAAEEVLMGKREVLDPVVIIGGGQVGLEVAEYLAEQRKEVTVIEQLDEPAVGTAAINKLPLLANVGALGVKIHTKVTVLEILEKEVLFRHQKVEKRIPAGTVIYAAGFEPLEDLFEEMKTRVPQVFRIGDCLKPRRILEAMAEGFAFGMTL